MTPLTSVLSAARTVTRQKWSVGFGPYLILGAVPWLLLATSLKIRVNSAPSAGVLPLSLLSEFALFIAFLIASDSAIKLAGGVTSLDRLSLSDQLRTARGALGRLLALCLGLSLFALALGFRGEPVFVHWVAFQGIAFNFRVHTSVLALSPIAATIVFMMVVEKGSGREPRLLNAVWQIGRRWRHLVPAMIAIAVFLGISMHLRAWLYPAILPLMETLASTKAAGIVYLSYLCAFAYVHLWATVNILTYTLRASYRTNEKDGSE